MTRYLQTIRQSVSIYTGTAVYAFAVLAMLLISTGDIMLISGVLASGLVTVLIMLVALCRETKQVHILVNSQHDAMVERVNQLVAALHEGGIKVPQVKEGNYDG